MGTAVVCVARDELGSISGVIRKVNGNLVKGATVTLTSDQTSAVTMRTTSGGSGEYRFAAIPLGNYRLAAILPGFVASASETIRLSSTLAVAKVDLTLTPQTQETDLKAGASSRPPPKFAAAGVRGLIDSGGYSAPANAAAAAVLISGVADIKRSGSGVGEGSGGASSKDWPCNLEPELEKALAANPENSEANRRLAEFYTAHDQAANAISLLERARRIDSAQGGQSADSISRDLAVAWMKTGKFDEARESLASLVERDQPGIHALLARADEGSGMFIQASHEYETAAKSEPSEDNLFGAGYELILAGLPAEAASAFHAGIQKYPHSITLLIGAGTAEFLQGHTSESIVSFLRATDVNPIDPRPYALLSSTSGTSTAESEKVRAALKRFLDLAPDNAQANYFYALNLKLARVDQPDSVEMNRVGTLLKRAIQLDPNFAKAHFQLGIFYTDHGENDNAIREYEATIGLTPDLNEAHYRLARAYRLAGETASAAHEMQLFQDARSLKNSKADDTENVEQFVLTVDPPGNHSDGAECPAQPR